MTMVITSYTPAHKISRITGFTWSKFNAHNCAYLVNFKCASTPYLEEVSVVINDYQKIEFKQQSLVITLSGGGKITDAGDRIFVEGKQGDAISAEMIVKLALVKGWKSIQFTGTNGFISCAMEQALDYGLVVVPKNPHQESLLLQIQRQREAGKAELKLANPSNSLLPSKEVIANRLKFMRDIENGVFEMPPAPYSKKIPPNSMKR